MKNVGTLHPQDSKNQVGKEEVEIVGNVEGLKQFFFFHCKCES